MHHRPQAHKLSQHHISLLSRRDVGDGKRGGKNNSHSVLDWKEKAVDGRRVSRANRNKPSQQSSCNFVDEEDDDCEIAEEDLDHY